MSLFEILKQNNESEINQQKKMSFFDDLIQLIKKEKFPLVETSLIEIFFHGRDFKLKGNEIWISSDTYQELFSSSIDEFIHFLIKYGGISENLIKIRSIHRVDDDSIKYLEVTLQ